MKIHGKTETQEFHEWHSNIIWETVTAHGYKFWTNFKKVKEVLNDLGRDGKLTFEWKVSDPWKRRRKEKLFSVYLVFREK